MVAQSVGRQGLNMKKYMAGGDIDHVGLENPYQKTRAKKPLPSEIKKEGKAPVDKYIKEPFRKANDQASKFLESKGLTNPVDVIDEELGGETVAEARARRQGMPVSKSSKYKSGGSVKSSASKRADGCAQRGKTRGKMV
jgi:hypothetical protein